MTDATNRSNLKPLSLYVPEPMFRPGDAVDFASVEVPPVECRQAPGHRGARRRVP